MDSISTFYVVPQNHTRVSFGEPFHSNKNALVNGSPALIDLASGLINRSTITMNELECISSQIKLMLARFSSYDLRMLEHPFLTSQNVLIK
jgi:hypothetical protein